MVLFPNKKFLFASMIPLEIRSDLLSPAFITACPSASSFVVIFCIWVLLPEASGPSITIKDPFISMSWRYFMPDFINFILFFFLTDFFNIML